MASQPNHSQPQPCRTITGNENLSGFALHDFKTYDTSTSWANAGANSDYRMACYISITAGKHEGEVAASAELWSMNAGSVSAGLVKQLIRTPERFQVGPDRIPCICVLSYCQPGLHRPRCEKPQSSCKNFFTSAWYKVISPCINRQCSRSHLEYQNRLF